MKTGTENDFEEEDKNSLHKDYTERDIDLSKILHNAKIATSHLESFNIDDHIRQLNTTADQIASARNSVGESKKKSRKWLYIGLVLFVILLGAAFGYYKFMGGGKNIVKTEWGNVAFDVPQSQDMVNVLAIGFDKGGYRTDTMMIISFNPKTSNVSLISIPRDTLVEINGKRMKLNAVFGVGKFDLTLNTIRKLTGLPIHYYVSVDTAGFRNIVDTLGGVDFNVPRDMKYTDPYQDLYIDLKKGPQHLDGKQAEQLVRYRKYAMGDLERENVQKDFIKALIEQKLTLANVSDMPKMKTVYDNLAKYVKTNISFNDMLRYFVSALKINSDSFKTYTLPGMPKMINGISYYVYSKKDTSSLYKQIMGQEAEAKIDLSQGIDVNDIESIANSKVQKDQIEVIHKSTSKGTSTIPSVDEIRINDGKDMEYSDVGDVTPINKKGGSDSNTPSSGISTENTEEDGIDSDGSGGSSTSTTNQSPSTTNNITGTQQKVKTGNSN